MCFKSFHRGWILSCAAVFCLVAGSPTLCQSTNSSPNVNLSPAPTTSITTATVKSESPAEPNATASTTTANLSATRDINQPSRTKGLHDTRTYIGVISALVLFVFVLSYSLVLLARSHAHRWIEDLRITDPGQAQNQLPNLLVSAAEQARLSCQLSEIKGRAEHHLKVMESFFNWYYMSLGTTALTGLIAAVALVFISRSGWNNVDPLIIAVFIVMAGAAAFYRSFPGVFRQEQNIADNKALYLHYIALENEMLSYTATGEDINGGAKKPAAEFIHYIDQQLANFNNIAIGFDATQVPDYKGIFDVSSAESKNKNKVREGAANSSPADGTKISHDNGLDKHNDAPLKKDRDAEVFPVRSGKQP